MRVGFAAILLSLLFFQTGFAESKADTTLIVSRIEEIYPLNQVCWIYRDKNGTLNYPQIQKQKGEFEPLNSALYYFSQDKEVKVYWLRCVIDNTLKKDFATQFYFLTGLDSVVLYQPLQNGAVFSLSASSVRSTQFRPTYLSQELALPVVLTPGRNEFYFKIINKSLWSQQRGAILLNLAEERSFTNYFLEYRHYHGIALGMLLVMVVFHIFIFVFFRDRTYLIFLINVTLTFFYLFLMKHYHEEVSWLGPALPVLRYLTDPIGVLLSITAILFAQSFLVTRETDSIMHRWMNGFIVLSSGVFACMTLQIQLALMNVISMSLGIGAALLVIVTSIRAIARGNKLSWYILMGFLFIFFVPIMYILQFLGRFPFRSVASDFHYFGEAFRSIIFAVGIAERFYIIKKDAARQRIEKQKMDFEKEIQIKLVRERISRDLHDNIGTQLSLLSSGLNRLLTDPAPGHIHHLHESMNLTLLELRDTIWAINKDEVTVQELEDKINTLFWRLRQSGQKVNYQLQISDVSEQQKLNPSFAINVFRIIQEAINNSLKHSEATDVIVSITQSGNQFELMITDNGKGFVVEESDKAEHYGLNNMQRRAEEIGGSFSLTSRIGKGTSIHVRFSI